MNSEDLKSRYQHVWQDVKDARRFVAAAFALFLLGNVLAWLSPRLSACIVALFIEYFRTFQGQTPLHMIPTIFLNNATVALLSILLGFFFGLFPAFTAVVNSIAVGAVLRMSPLNFFMILPHAVFELPAIFLAWGRGFWCAGWLLQVPRLASIKRRMKHSLNIYACLVLPMLAVAAVLEVVGGMLFSR